VPGNIGDKGLSKHQPLNTNQQQAMMVLDCWCWSIEDLLVLTVNKPVTLFDFMAQGFKHCE
jgi:hypothetical protein